MLKIGYSGFGRNEFMVICRGTHKLDFLEFLE